jgi:hypothetical protein
MDVATRSSCVGSSLLADVDVCVGEGALEEDCPEVVDGVAGGDGEDSFVLEAARGGEHFEFESEADLADGVEAAGDVGVFAVAADVGVEAADANHILRPQGKDSSLRRLHVAARGGKQAKNRAVVAVARKLAVLLHRIWTTQEPYAPFCIEAA